MLHGSFRMRLQGIDDLERLVIVCLFVCLHFDDSGSSGELK